jgi:hypothetical protein
MADPSQVPFSHNNDGLFRPRPSNDMHVEKPRPILDKVSWWYNWVKRQLESMEIIQQKDTLEKERAKHNRDETLRHLSVNARQREFLEIGRLLTECKEQQYFRALNYPSFWEYVKSGLEGKIKPPDASRDMWHCRLSKDRNGRPPEVLRKIGKAKMDLLLTLARAGQVSPELWKMAEDYSFEKLRRELSRYRSLGRPVPITGEEGSRHREIQVKITGMGESLGKYAQIEYWDYPQKKYKYDVVWKNFEQALGVTHVFEVSWGTTTRVTYRN